jgi:hypothetical protein
MKDENDGQARYRDYKLRTATRLGAAWPQYRD